MTTTIYDVYGEDGDFAYMNGSVGSGVTINTSSGFRSAYARCAVQFSPGSAGTFGLRYWSQGACTTGWFGMRYQMLSQNFNNNNKFTNFFVFCDVNGVPRIVVTQYYNSTTSNLLNQYTVSKINAAQTTTTQLFITTSGFSVNPTVPDQVSFNFNYSTSGFITMYINSSQVGTFSGDITTDGQTALGGTYHADPAVSGTSGYSECVLSSTDTRNFNVYTNAARAAGTLDQWTGAYTNVNAISVNDANFDTTTTSGNAQRYLMGDSMPTGNYDILAKVTNLRATQGGGSLTHLALTELLGGTVETSATTTFPAAFGPKSFIQMTNPKTGVAWTQADINSTTRESGYIATT